ncbi:hypothetical protein BJX76DRAFT_362767 [Aspergillus varians]
MFARSSLLAAIGGSALVAAAPGFVRSSQTPCAQISQHYAEDLKANTSSLFPATLAIECLQSMPFEPNRAVVFVDELSKYLEWHSTADTLSNPPTSYLSTPVDIWGSLEDLKQQVKENKFASQFEFDNAVSDLLQSVQDGHVSIIPCSRMPFLFGTSENLISVSSDGLELPDIYTLNDAQVLKTNPDSVSPVVTINGEDAVSQLEDIANQVVGGFQDPDARYNNLFYSLFRFTGGGQSGAFGVGDDSYRGIGSYALAYANGTNSTVKMSAGYRNRNVEFNFADGRELYGAFCLPLPPSNSTTEDSEDDTAVLPAPAGYPKAAIREKNNLIAGYLPDEPNLADAAVLVVPTFTLDDIDNRVSVVSNLVIEFIQKAVDAGKKKIILDLSTNPGGDTTWAFDLFTIFFPNKTPYSSSRLRAHEALYLFEKLAYAVPEDDARFLDLVTYGLLGFNTPNQTYTYQSADEFYGPHDVLGSNMTIPNAENFDLISTAESPIHGYGGIKTNFTEPPFAPEDILIITDGDCSSSCPIFTELMTYEGVKTLAFGGRPQYGPMQAMGGTRGGQVLPLSALQEFMGAALDFANETDVLSKSEIEEFAGLIPFSRPSLRVETLNVNLRDAFSKDDKDSLMPLQYVYQPAHCRLFYTFENLFSPATAWTAAYNAIWGDADCVAGSRF